MLLQPSARDRISYEIRQHLTDRLEVWAQDIDRLSGGTVGFRARLDYMLCSVSLKYTRKR